MTNALRNTVTGLVLAGGEGRRMGGVDKGLQPLQGVPLAALALQRLQPQVHTLLLSANRNLERYAALGWPVLPDSVAAQGPLAGVLAALQACRTPWLATVPCDVPNFPADLVARLGDALAGAPGATMAIAACTGRQGLQLQPLCSLQRADTAAALQARLQRGERSAQAWAASQQALTVVFDDASAFFNANTHQDLERLHR